MVSIEEAQRMLETGRAEEQSFALTKEYDWQITPIYHKRLDAIHDELTQMNRHLAALVNVLSAATRYLGSPYPDEG